MVEFLPLPGNVSVLVMRRTSLAGPTGTPAALQGGKHVPRNALIGVAEHRDGGVALARARRIEVVVATRLVQPGIAPQRVSGTMKPTLSSGAPAP